MTYSTDDLNVSKIRGELGNDCFVLGVRKYRPFETNFL